MKTTFLLKAAAACIFFALLTAVFAQFEIPLPYVPISGQTLAVGLTATILGSSLGMLSMIIYIAAGVAGVPAFTGFDAGMDVLKGPTGGYIIGFIFAAYVIGRFLEKYGFTVTKAIYANVIGMIIILLTGMIWLKYSVNMSWLNAFTSGVTPFIITGLIKACLAGWIGIKINGKLKERGLELRPTTQFKK